MRRTPDQRMWRTTANREMLLERTNIEGESDDACGKCILKVHVDFFLNLRATPPTTLVESAF